MTLRSPTFPIVHMQDMTETLFTKWPTWPKVARSANSTRMTPKLGKHLTRSYMALRLPIIMVLRITLQK